METSKKDRIYKIIMLVCMTAIITFMFTTIGMYNYFTKTEKGTKEILKNVEISDNATDLEYKLKLVKALLDKYYIGELNTDDMLEMAVKGYVAGVDDEYTEYLTKDEYEELLVNVTGDYVGIGIYMYEDSNGNIIVLMPMEGSPAKEAGLQENDVIVSINGESCSDMDINVASSKIKGPEGTTVELEILRGTETIKKTIERRTVEIADSTSKVLDGNIGYIELKTFDEDCSDKIEQYLNDFQNKGIKSVIIDLRNNTGGIVTEAIEFAELFVNKGDIIMRSYNKTEDETVVKAKKGKSIDMKVVLLTNEYSASASEIVTAALKDNKVATIVGTTTYGKGVMQEIVPIFEGALKVTIEEFKTPNGDKINKVGITPDIVVEDDLETKEDEQLQKAIETVQRKSDDGSRKCMEQSLPLCHFKT